MSHLVLSSHTCFSHITLQQNASYLALAKRVVLWVGRTSPQVAVDALVRELASMNKDPFEADVTTHTTTQPSSPSSPIQPHTLVSSNSTSNLLAFMQGSQKDITPSIPLPTTSQTSNIPTQVQQATTTTVVGSPVSTGISLPSSIMSPTTLPTNTVVSNVTTNTTTTNTIITNTLTSSDTLDVGQEQDTTYVCLFSPLTYFLYSPLSFNIVYTLNHILTSVTLVYPSTY